MAPPVDENEESEKEEDPTLLNVNASQVKVVSPRESALKDKKASEPKNTKTPQVIQNEVEIKEPTPEEIEIENKKKEPKF